MRRIALVLTLLTAFAAYARIGGGDTYSGSSSSSSSSSGSSSSDYGGSSGGSSGPSSGGGDSGVGLVLFLFFGLIFIGGFVNSLRTQPDRVLVVAPAATTGEIGLLRGFDPNFSPIVFTDFCYSLFARLYEAVGRGRVDDFAPYVSAAAREGLNRHAPAGLTAIDAIVIGSFSVTGVRGMDTPRIEADVEFEANYNEKTATGERRWYVREVWTLTRARDLLSPVPEKARAEHCPKCGAPLQTRTDGACLHCGAVITDGTFNWFLQSIRGVSRDERPPQLGGGGAGIEPGLERETVMQPWIGRQMTTFVKEHPDFTWEAFEERVRFIAAELQDAWTARDWRRARPLETAALFLMHRYWIDEYLRQGVQNIVDHYTIDRVEVARVTSDAFYDAITVRLYASGHDYTLNQAGALIGGSATRRRSWSEYWTLVRGRVAGAADARVCPNCGADRAEGQSAICEYCGGKITSGKFPWVLSRIEQDEAYRG